MPEAEKKIGNWLKLAPREGRRYSHGILADRPVPEKSVVVNFFQRLVKLDQLPTDDRYFIEHILAIIKKYVGFRWLWLPDLFVCVGL